MKIDITEIAGKDSAIMEISAIVNRLNLEHEILGVTLESDVDMALKLTYIKGYIFVKGQAKGLYQAKCHRCLKQIDGTYDVTLEEKFSLVSERTDDESYPYEGHFIDISSLLIDNILLSFPTTILCEDECKGLCPKCGINLNIKQCTCETQEINLKMEKLKDYFTK